MVGVKDSLLAHSSDPVEMRRLNYQTQGMDQHTFSVPLSLTHTHACIHTNENGTKTHTLNCETQADPDKNSLLILCSFAVK